jgi:hypothetical protein
MRKEQGLDFESNSVCGKDCVQNEGTSQCSGECDNEAHCETNNKNISM